MSPVIIPSFRCGAWINRQWTLPYQDRLFFPETIAPAPNFITSLMFFSFLTSAPHCRSSDYWMGAIVKLTKQGGRRSDGPLSSYSRASAADGSSRARRKADATKQGKHRHSYRMWVLSAFSYECVCSVFIFLEKQLQTLPYVLPTFHKKAQMKKRTRNVSKQLQTLGNTFVLFPAVTSNNSLHCFGLVSFPSFLLFSKPCVCACVGVCARGGVRVHVTVQNYFCKYK